MLSEAARTYDRSRKIKPLNRSQRQKVYSSHSVNVEKKIGQKKFSPFNTIDRTARTSYLLRVTKQPNAQTNYNLNHDFILKKDRRSTIDRAKFERIIGDVKKQDFSVQLKADENPQRCFRSQTLSPQGKRPLTVRDHQNWRKTHQHFDFNRQQSTKRVKLFPKLSFDQSTNQSFMHTLRNTIQSNFNNYDRMKFVKPKPSKAHDFKSYFGHEYLKELQDGQKSPQYDIQACNEQFVRLSMAKPKDKKLQPDSTVTIHSGIPHLKYNYQDKQEERKLDNIKGINVYFDEQPDRKPNDIHSKYPIRLSLQHVKKLNESP